MSTEAKACWEYWSCTVEKRRKCIAHKKNHGEFCWLLPKAFVPKAEREFTTCWKCPWFHKTKISFSKGRSLAVVVASGLFLIGILLLLFFYF